MNDRFKFRVFLKAHNQMCNVHTLHTGTNKVIISTRYGNSSVQINDYNILMQCTGLKDKNGKLIYEGDVLYENMINTVFPKGKYWIVEWNNNNAQFFIELINKTGNSLTDTWHLARHNLDYEVIGNIYENKELLDE